MALHMDTSNCVDGPDLWEGAALGMTNALAMWSIAVQLREITADNVDEWMYRLGELTGLYGPLLQDENGPMDFPREAVERRIGTTLNIAPVTRAEFNRDIKRRRKQHEQDARWAAENGR